MGRLGVTQRDGRYDQFGNRGGAIYAGWYAHLVVADTEFTTNYAADYGGALYFEWLLDSGVLVNNIFTGNQVNECEQRPSRGQSSA
jgi:predicted outer membrane repeat protein